MHHNLKRSVPGKVDRMLAGLLLLMSLQVGNYVTIAQVTWAMSHGHFLNLISENDL